MGQSDLFSLGGDEAIVRDIPNGRLIYFPNAFAALEADGHEESLTRAVSWQQDEIKIAGKTIAIPRLQCLLGDGLIPYSYSGITIAPKPFPEAAKQILQRIERLSDHRFNVALANLYRDQNDSVDWHSDDEKSLGVNPVIASASFGAVRRFELRHRYDKSAPRQKIELAHGSLLIMEGETQHYWHHRLPKLSRPCGPRINLTFRQLV